MRIFGFGRSKGKKIESQNRNNPKPISNLTALDPDDVIAAHNLGRNKNTGSFIHRAAERELSSHVKNDGVCVISLHGPSKQGKTTILRNVFGENSPSIAMEASAGISRTELYGKILKKAGAKIEVGEQELIAGRIAVGVPGMAAEIGSDVAKDYKFIEGSLTDADWVAELLSQVTTARVIVIDSFHHITEKEQTDLAKDFTIFGGRGFTIVAAGTWKQGNYLVERNSDLSGQHRNISVDPWSDDELKAVALAGVKTLNVHLPDGIADAFAKDAKGSVAALQEICQQFYLDQIKDDPAYSKLSARQKVNTAAQRVSSRYSRDMALRLDKLSKWGSTDESGRHHVSYITEAMLFSTPTEFSEGFSIEELKKRVNKATKGWIKFSGHKGLSRLSDSDFAKKVKSQWTSHQAKINNTPVFVWDRTIDRFIVNDSMLVFVHHTNRSTLLKQYRTQISNRLGV